MLGVAYLQVHAQIKIDYMHAVLCIDCLYTVMYVLTLVLFEC